MSDDKEAIYKEFREAVNMAPKELEEWLETDESKSVGDSDGGESTGHKSGRRIVEIKRKNKDELTDSDYSHMKKVNQYVARHLKQPPKKEDKKTSRWRYSLMNWGHDPLK
ncbi:MULTISPECIES: DUF3140 domain-containing protein [unclassified Halomonas]|uniref:DUF3140 domain-containing protein n=1 Tax=unclassified Halomonas TaxID=2609666 RepID=UPI0021E4E6C3|nr:MULTISPECIES: DUF3140 domain-containing protein [unclassified Halomonas]UYG01584.1 DUF3140 domain-containing protein [Halomonas sp. GD1P12]WNL40676.1 DUF3140 domain-containing protein [Halomonas sp. PAMB 3264]